MLLAAAAGTAPFGPGLRSGPARNPRWAGALHAVASWRGDAAGAGVWVAAMAKERARWVDDADRLLRAARHYEGAAAAITARCVESAAQFASAPARIDWAGGWTDTPPVSF
eukprot:gene3993-35400_t